MTEPTDGHPEVDAGQATVEVALILPLLVLLVMGIVQVGTIVRDQVLVTAAAREAVRAYAVSGNEDAAQAAAGAGGGLDPPRLRVMAGEQAGTGELVVARVTYTCVTDLPLIGALVPDVDLTAEAVMHSEV